MYDQLEVNEVLKKCLKEGMKGKVKLGAVKHQILQFLTQLTVVLPKSFWQTLCVLILNCRTDDIKKGFKHLGQHPNLAECMKFCPEYHNALA